MGGYISQRCPNPKLIFEDNGYSPPPFIDVSCKKSTFALCFIINQFENLKTLQTELAGILQSLQVTNNINVSTLFRLKYEQSCPFDCNSISTVVSIQISLPPGLTYEMLVEKINLELAPAKFICSTLYFDQIRFCARKFANSLSFQYLLPKSLFEKMGPLDFDNILNLSSLFIGTHLFHSFNKKDEDKNDKRSAIKTVVRFELVKDKEITIQNTNFVVLVIETKSTFKFQIEKMVSLFVLLVLNKISDSKIKKRLDYQMYKINTAPNEPLILSEVNYDNFKKSIKGDINNYDLTFHDGCIIKKRALDLLHEKIADFYINGSGKEWVNSLLA